MSKILKDLKYSSSHEWVKLEGNVATIGISDYAQESLGSIVYVDADLGQEVKKGQDFGVVESVKAASDLIAPLSGKIIEMNQDVIDAPELLNEDSYTNWIIKLEIIDQTEYDKLLDADQYEKELD